MPIILHIETATDVCSVCLGGDGQLLSLRENTEGYTHAAQITLLIESCLAEAQLSFSDLDAIALSTGPGSYTSLRVGTSAAKALCYGLDVPLIVVDTLASLALAATQQHPLPPGSRCIPMLDARRMEVYTAVFGKNMEILAPTQAKIIEEGAFSEWLEPNNRILFCGNGIEKCKSLLDHPQMAFSDVTCSSRHLIRPALESYINDQFENVAYFAPFYLKSPVITAQKKKII